MSLRLWDEQVVPRLTDLSLRGHEIGALRARACAGIAGSVLEVGFGSGLNVRWYPPEVSEVGAVEPSDVAWAISGKRRARTEIPVRRIGLDGQHLDVDDATYDSALVTFSLCTIPDPLLALREIRRVLRPGGHLHFIEHGLSPDPAVAAWQRRLNGIEQAVAGGCHLTREAATMLGEAGWTVDRLEQLHLPGPSVSRPWTWLSLGTAS